MVKVVLAVELNVPEMVVVLPELVTDVINGKFCRLFGPVSPSQASLSAGPLPLPPLLKSMPNPPLADVPLLVLEEIEFPRTELLMLLLPSMMTPSPNVLLAPLNAMRLAAPAFGPPIVLLAVPTM